MNENGTVSRLTRKQSLFIEAQLAGANLTVAAKTAGIGYTTAQRWQKMEAIRDALKSGEQALFEAALDELMKLVPKALETLQKHLDADVEPTASTQLTASIRLIEQAIDVHRSAEIEKRIAALEEKEGIG